MGSPGIPRYPQARQLAQYGGIGIYVDVANDEKPTGIGLHVRYLVHALADLDRDNEYLLYYQCGLREHRSLFPLQPRQPNFRLRPVRFPTAWKVEHPTVWWEWYLPWVLRRDRLDIFHGPNHFLPAFDPHKSLVTIHDLAYFSMQVHTFNDVLQAWTRKALTRAAAVIALSENTRRDVEALGVEPERIRVIYGGGNIVPEDQIQYCRISELKKLLRLPEQYILFVGTLQPRKNVPFLLRSFARLKRESNLPHRLVLAGQREAAAEEIDRLISALGISSDVLITGYVEDWQLPLLYRLADVFVLPTRYEGFTLVTLEAMAYGTPVIATDTSSIREGVGDAAILVELDNVEALARAIYTALTDDGLRHRLITQGKLQARKFTWEQCARDTLAIYHKIYDIS